MKLYALLLALALVALGACGNSSADTRTGDERPAPWEMTFHKVERKTSIAPKGMENDASYAQKAMPGKTFECVQYLAVNKGQEAAYTPTPKLSDGASTYDFDSRRSAFYDLGDWTKKNSDKIPPGESSQESYCFEVPETAPPTGQLVFVDAGWGKTKGWHTALALK